MCDQCDSSGGVIRLARKVWSLILRWRRWRYERSLLAAMTGAELKDVGISRADAHEELRRSFWSRGSRG